MNESAAAASDPQAEPGPGAVLRMAREARGATIAEIAAALKMSPRQIEAIESEDFSRLSGPTFVRGFVRNYARLLKIDAAPLLDALAERAALPQVELNAPADVGVKMPVAHVRHGKSLLPATLAALALLAVALLLYFDVIDPLRMLWRQDAPGPAIAQQAEQPVQPDASAGLPAAAPAADSKPGQAGEAAPVAGAGELRFSFEGNSWVEVRDASGRTIFSQMNAKGSTQTVQGLPPLQLVIGNASSVRLQYNGEAVDLAPHTRVEVARLTLE